MAKVESASGSLGISKEGIKRLKVSLVVLAQRLQGMGSRKGKKAALGSNISRKLGNSGGRGRKITKKSSPGQVLEYLRHAADAKQKLLSLSYLSRMAEKEQLTSNMDWGILTRFFELDKPYHEIKEISREPEEMAKYLHVPPQAVMTICWILIRAVKNDTEGRKMWGTSGLMERIAPYYLLLGFRNSGTYEDDQALAAIAGFLGSGLQRLSQNQTILLSQVSYEDLLYIWLTFKSRKSGATVVKEILMGMNSLHASLVQTAHLPGISRDLRLTTVNIFREGPSTAAEFLNLYKEKKAPKCRALVGSKPSGRLAPTVVGTIESGKERKEKTGRKDGKEENKEEKNRDLEKLERKRARRKRRKDRRKLAKMEHDKQKNQPNPPTPIPNTVTSSPVTPTPNSDAKASKPASPTAQNASETPGDRSEKSESLSNLGRDSKILKDPSKTRGDPSETHGDPSETSGDPSKTPEDASGAINGPSKPLGDSPETPRGPSETVKDVSETVRGPAEPLKDSRGPLETTGSSSKTGEDREARRAKRRAFLAGRHVTTLKCMITLYDETGHAFEARCGADEKRPDARLVVCKRNGRVFKSVSHWAAYHSKLRKKALRREAQQEHIRAKKAKALQAMERRRLQEVRDKEEEKSKHDLDRKDQSSQQKALLNRHQPKIEILKHHNSNTPRDLTRAAMANPFDSAAYVQRSTSPVDDMLPPTPPRGRRWRIKKSPSISSVGSSSVSEVASPRGSGRLTPPTPPMIAIPPPKLRGGLETKVKGDFVVVQGPIAKGESGNGLLAKIQELVEMHKAGFLTHEEFTVAKRKILNM
uniref:SHOCT domain-containing protein n=1 Tax=Amorphochlora amoebiformis TaxID=1561963 RepID=A0A7S0DN05_9EUKA